LCTACGFNFQTGDPLPSARPNRASRLHRSHGTTSGALWPILVGVISIVLGAAGTLMYGVMFLGAAFASGNGDHGSFKPRLMALGTIGLPMSLALWLARDGYRIVRKNSEGVKWIRFWAMTKLLVYGSCLSICMAVPSRSLDEGLHQARSQSGDLITLTGSDIKSFVLLAMLWFMAWPIFVMVFFFVPRIQQDVETWD
jgi:hypothetical protein